MLVHMFFKDRLAKGGPATLTGVKPTQCTPTEGSIYPRVDGPGVHAEGIHWHTTYDTGHSRTVGAYENFEPIYLS